VLEKKGREFMCEVPGRREKGEERTNSVWSSGVSITTGLLKMRRLPWANYVERNAALSGATKTQSPSIMETDLWRGKKPTRKKKKKNLFPNIE